MERITIIDAGATMREMSKAVYRRMSTPGFVQRYFVGNGIDIGGAPDPLGNYRQQFPGMTELRVWDLKDGDAQYMHGVPDMIYDFVVSSHCLEHLNDPSEGLKNWFRILKPGGHLIVTIPDEDMYEQGIFPSTFNHDHKFSFTIFKPKSWSPLSVNVLDLIRNLGAAADLQHLIQLNSTFQYDVKRADQTLMPSAECAIEFVIRRRHLSEIELGGRLPYAL